MPSLPCSVMFSSTVGFSGADPVTLGLGAHTDEECSGTPGLSWGSARVGCGKERGKGQTEEHEWERGRRSMEGMEGPWSRGWVASKGNSKGPGPHRSQGREGPLPRCHDCSAQRSWEPVVSGKSETTGAPPPPPPPLLGLLSCTLLQTSGHSCTYTST